VKLVVRHRIPAGPAGAESPRLCYE
jgi:hypothetical protein